MITLILALSHDQSGPLAFLTPRQFRSFWSPPELDASETPHFFFLRNSRFSQHTLLVPARVRGPRLVFAERLRTRFSFPCQFAPSWPTGCFWPKPLQRDDFPQVYRCTDPEDPMPHSGDIDLFPRDAFGRTSRFQCDRGVHFPQSYCRRLSPLIPSQSSKVQGRILKVFCKRTHLRKNPFATNEVVCAIGPSVQQHPLQG